MALEPIGDIGQQQVEVADVLELGWSTQIDWDEGTFKRDTYAENGDVKILGFQDDFESGTLDNWEVNNASINTGRTLSGGYSMYAGTGVNNDYQARTRISPGGGEIPDFSYHYQETTNSTGAGFRVRNSDGQFELGVSTDNPEWDITDANGHQEVDGGSNYDDWHKVEVTFDWSAGTFDVYWENLSTGRNGTYTDRPLIEGKDAEYLEFWEYNGGEWGNSDIVHWIDDVSVSSKDSGRYISTEKTFSEPIKPSLKNLDYTLNNGELEITAIGSPGTASQEKQTGYISTGTTQGLDWENAHTNMQLDITLIRGTGSPVFSGATLYREDVELDGVYDLYPEKGDSLTITADVINHTATEETFDVTITLPSEMSTNDSLTKTTGAIPQEGTDSVSWTVDANSTGIGIIEFNLLGNTSGYTTTSPAPVEIMEEGEMRWGGKFEWDNSFEYEKLKHHGSNSDVLTQSTKTEPGYLITRTKSFESPIQPDLVQMDYDININKVQVQITGSPNTGSEETKTVTLVDNPAQEITDWSSSHTEYRLRFDLDVDDSTVEDIRPVVRSISLGTATTNTNVSWSSTEDWDSNKWENGITHENDVVTFSPVWRQEYDFPDGDSTTSVTIAYNSFIAQRDFYGHARMTSMNPNGWTYEGSIEFGEIVNSASDDWDKTREKFIGTSGEITATLEDIQMEQYTEYFLGYSRAEYYNAAEYDTTESAEVVGTRQDGFKTNHYHTRLGTNNDGSTLGFSKLEFKESYLFSDFKYTTREIQPSISNMDYNIGNLNSIKVIVIGSPETPKREKHVLNVQGEQFEDIEWNDSHLKFQIQVVATDSDGSTTLNSLTLDDAQSPTNVIASEERETEVDLAWSNPITFDEVRVYRAETDSYDLDDYTLLDTLLGSATSYTDSGLETWQDYYYIVVGVQGTYMGESEPASAVPHPISAVGWHSKEDWDAGQDELGVEHAGMHPRLIKAEPKLAKVNAENLEYYFPFDGDFIDYSGNRNHGSITKDNIQYSDDAVIGQSLEITEESGWAGFNHFFDSSPSFGSATISVWVKNNQDSSDERIILTYDQSEYFALYVNGPGGSGIIVHDTNNNTTTVESDTYIDDGEWHHISVVLNRYDPDDENVKFYIDGVKETTSSEGKDAGYGSGLTRYGHIGNNSEGSSFDDINQDVGNQAFKGKIDDLRFYRAYAMTDEEIQYLRNYGKKGAYHTTNIKTTPPDSQL